MGSLYARLGGNNNPASGIPRNVLLLPTSAGEPYKDLIRKGPERFSNVGDLNLSYAPFDPSAGGEVVENMELRLPEDRFDNRRVILGALDGLRRQMDSSDALASADAARKCDSELNRKALPEAAQQDFQYAAWTTRCGDSG